MCYLVIYCYTTKYTIILPYMLRINYLNNHKLGYACAQGANRIEEVCNQKPFF